jgi:hypothetical protein
MIVLLSGEGPTDLGHCINSAGLCDGEDFRRGPLTEVIDQMLESLLFYESPLSHDGACVFVSENELSRRAKDRSRRSVSFVGKKSGQETSHFYLNAWMLAECALELEAKHRDHAIAVLFRDADATRSAPSNTWSIKHRSMVDGFKRAGFSRGVPMLPRPKSEAWLLALCKPVGENVESLEEWSGNDASANSLKSLLSAARQERVTAEELRDWLAAMPIELARLDSMQSFRCFREALTESVALLLRAAKLVRGRAFIADTTSGTP